MTIGEIPIELLTFIGVAALGAAWFITVAILNQIKSLAK